MEVEAVRVLSAAICMSIGVIGPALAEGKIASKAMESIGRNPSISNDIFSKMIVAMAVTESTAIFCLVISLIILFVK